MEKIALWRIDRTREVHELVSFLQYVLYHWILRKTQCSKHKKTLMRNLKGD